MILEAARSGAHRYWFYCVSLALECEQAGRYGEAAQWLRCALEALRVLGEEACP